MYLFSYDDLFDKGWRNVLRKSAVDNFGCL